MFFNLFDQYRFIKKNLHTLMTPMCANNNEAYFSNVYNTTIRTYATQHLIFAHCEHLNSQMGHIKRNCPECEWAIYGRHICSSLNNV